MHTAKSCMCNEKGLILAFATFYLTLQPHSKPRLLNDQKAELKHFVSVKQA